MALVGTNLPRRILHLAPALIPLALLGAACGPVLTTSLVMDADVELSAARTAGGEKLAPYEFTSAEVYLHKAKEEQGYSDYRQSIDFAEKALKHARDAKKKALAAKSEGALPGDEPLGPYDPDGR